MRSGVLSVAILGLAGLPLRAAEAPSYAPLPSVESVVHGLQGLKAFKAASRKRVAAPKALTEWVRLDVYQYSDDSFTVSDHSRGVDVRADKIFRDDFDFRLFGRAGGRPFDGDARSKFMRDPSWGYTLRGSGFDAQLDRFGDGWILRGSCEAADGKGAPRRDSFNLRIDRDFPGRDDYRIWEAGLDLRIRATSWSSSVDGSYDASRVGPSLLALIGTSAGIINQPKLRRDPRRP